MENREKYKSRNREKKKNKEEEYKKIKKGERGRNTGGTYIEENFVFPVFSAIFTFEYSVLIICREAEVTQALKSCRQQGVVKSLGIYGTGGIPMRTATV